MADIISGNSRFKVQNTNPSDEYAATNVPAKRAGGSGPEDDGYGQKIKKHRIKSGIVIGLAVMAVVIGLILIWKGMDNVKYSSYTIIKSVNKDDTDTAKYIDFNGGYIRYSNDGISYYSKKGTAIWNQTYQMKNPQVKICDKNVAVGDLNGSSIYIFDESGMLGNVDTSLTIAQIEVASQGVVATVLEDTSSNYINLYSTDGDKIYSVKTTLAGDGYPLDISISDDATKLMASYVYVSGDSIKTNVVFYNFSDVGQNETERVVGGFNHYDSTIVPEVQFINNSSAIAMGENIISFYKIKEYPSLSKEVAIDSEIDRVFSNDKYVGVVVKNGDSGDIYKLMVYNLSGGKVCETTFNTEYNTIKFDDNSIILYNDTVFTLLNMKGNTMITQVFDLPVEAVLSLGTRGDYILVSSKYIQEIKLK